MITRNAVILAAGKSKRFAPFTYEKPKGLFRVRGEILIERQIQQLQEAGIQDIYLVLGFMKEKYFYLEKKYGVKFLVNNTYETSGNICSLYAAREQLGNTFICCADHYFEENPFLEEKDYTYRICVKQPKGRKKFAVKISDAGVITHIALGGQGEYAMAGQAYFTESFSKKFLALLEKELDDFGVKQLFWEDFLSRHTEELTVFAEIKNEKYVREFDSLEELRAFDKEFFENIDSDILVNICHILKCAPNDITNIQVIQKGLTNVSFRFSVDDTEYVYRYPGSTAGNMVDRSSEVVAQSYAKECGIDRSIIYIDLSGWKLSYYIKDLVPFTFSDGQQLERAMEYLRELHRNDGKEAKDFDAYQEALHLMDIASAAKGNLRKEFSELVEKTGRLNTLLKKENRPRVLCHNDIYAPNFLTTKSGDLYLIDWEYAGRNYPAYDVACILSRDMFTEQEMKKYIACYTNEKLTPEVYRHYLANIVLCGFYWFCWGLYKGSMHDDDGFFMIPAYRNCVRFIDLALQEYEEAYGGET
ncbi:phosphotransferase [Fournierella massiliensis]|nr:phosphotransferase [Fournierella massiliensis]MCF2557960.1 phosphotransferase [Fournierella massiliensis]